MTESVTADPLLAVLIELALDLRWCWNHATDELWRRLDPEPVATDTQSLGSASDRFATSDPRRVCCPHFSQEGRPNAQRKTRGGRWAAWVQTTHPRAPLTCVAYFSMELMLSEALPIYSGGLGNVAGDLLKAASDLGGPSCRGRPPLSARLFPPVHRSQWLSASALSFQRSRAMPIKPLRDAIGEWLRLRCICRRRPSGCARGKLMWAEPNCICWTPTTPPTCRRIAVLPVSYTVAGPIVSPARVSAR